MQQAGLLSDFDIIDKLLCGEKDFYEILIRRHNPLLYKIGRSYGLAHHDVQDLMQDTYLTAYQSLPGFGKRSQFSTWLVRIMINKCLYKLKMHRSHNPLNAEIENSNMNGQIKNGEHFTIQHELSKVLEKAIEKLPEHYRMVFLLRQTEGFSVNDTASILNLTPINVKVRLNRAKALLREYIEAWYPKADIYEFHLQYCTRVVENVLSKIEVL